MVGNISRTSMLIFKCRMFIAAPGLALIRKYFAHHCRNCGSLAAEGARRSIETGPPHSLRRASADTSKAKGSLPHGQSGAICLLAYAPYRTSELTRCG